MSKKSILESKLLNAATSKGSSEVYRYQIKKELKDKIRAKYGADVIKSAIFNTEHDKKEEFLNEINDIDNKYEYVEMDFKNDE